MTRACETRLCYVCAQVVTSEQMQKGFAGVVNSVDDILLDVPDAINLIAVFIERAVVDDILPPSFVHRLTGLLCFPSLSRSRYSYFVLIIRFADRKRAQ